MSSEPPPRLSSSGSPPGRQLGDLRRQARLPARPAPSAGPLPASSRPRVHVGRPTALMFSYIVSASGLFMCGGQAVPRTRDVTTWCRSSAPRLRPSCCRSPSSSLMCGVVGLAEVVPDAGVARHDVGLVAAVGDHVVRALLQAQVLAAVVPAAFISSTASSADRPRHGAPALCAVSPLKVYSTETSPLPPPRPTTSPGSCRRG